MTHNKRLVSDPKFLLQFMEDIDSDLSDNDFDGYIDDENEAGENVRDDDVEGVDIQGLVIEGNVDMQGTAREERMCHRRDDAEVHDMDEIGDAMDTEIQEEVELQTVDPDNPEMWENESDNVNNPNIPHFTQQTGVTINTSNYEPVDFFMELFTDQLSEYAVVEFNRYGQQYLQKNSTYLDEHPKARAYQLKNKPFTTDDMKKFLGLVVSMGLVNMPNIQNYWCTTWPFSSSNFSSIMSRDRFLLQLKFLHLADNNAMIARGEPGCDKLFKVRYLLTTLVHKYQEMYTMKREISVDGSVIAYKGRLSFLQYLPKKSHKWGMKAWVLAEADTGYTWNFHLYAVKEEARPTSIPLGTHVVRDLVRELVGKGYHVYFDNFYTSPELCKSLLTDGFGSCGTVRLDRKGILASFKRKELPTGGFEHFRDGPLPGLKWKDKRVVALLTTIHDNKLVTVTRWSKGATGREEVTKPQGVVEYNKYMGGVDKAGQVISYYGYNNFSKKWWKRVFFHLLDVTRIHFILQQC